MPDKQNDNKFMAMLERRGIVRKTDSENDQPETDSGAAPARPDVDLRAMFGPPADETMKITPAARQPIPGMTNPVIPNEKQQSTERELPQPMEARVIEITKPELPVTTESPIVEQTPDIIRDIVQTRVVEPPMMEQPRAVDTAAQAPYSRGFAPLEDNSQRTETYAAVDDPGAAEHQQQPTIDDYTDRYIDIDDLYKVLSLRSKKTDTIYLIEDYLSSLPESLPDESRREIVGKIVSASGFDYDLLMGDGVLRVKMLKEYAERFARHTDNYITACQAELSALDQQILRVREQIENRRELHKKQFFAIEAEAQRLKDILAFING